MNGQQRKIDGETIKNKQKIKLYYDNVFVCISFLRNMLPASFPVKGKITT